MSREFHRRRLPLLAATVALAGALLAAPPGAGVAGAVPSGGVYMRDNDPSVGLGWPTDNGFESNPWADIAHSPDIHVPTLIVGGTSNIVVTLRNDGDTPITGTLYMYYTRQGTAAKWQSDWIDLNAVSGITVPKGTRDVAVPWVRVPGPGHFCLLARWVSADDMMTFPEGTSTYTNARNNNNIAWHNADTVRVPINHWVWWPIRVRNTDSAPKRFNLVLAQPERPFVGPGRLVLDLGPTLAARWRQAGQPGIGVRPIGDTQVEILDPRRASILDVLINPDDLLDVSLGFTAGDGARGGQFPVRVLQTDTQNDNVGGLDLTAVVE